MKNWPEIEGMTAAGVPHGIFLLLLLSLLSGCSAMNSKQILTDEELRETGPAPAEAEVERELPLPGAPQIIIDTPAADADVSMPVAVRIRFVAQPGAAILPDSLRAVYHGEKKDKDITEDLRDKLAISDGGIEGSIKRWIPKSMLPWPFEIRLAISDDQSRTGTAQLRFRVVE